MNLLPIVLGVLFVLSWGSIAIYEKHLSFRKFQKIFHQLKTAERSCHQKVLLKSFQKLPGIAAKKESKKKPSSSTPPKKKQIKIPEINPICAKINLFPLFQEGADLHPELAALAQKTLKSLYESVATHKQLDELFVALLQSKTKAQEEKREFTLETVDLGDLDLQKLYYQLLKGMRHPNLFSSKKIPSLLDHFKIDPNPSQVCVLHAHPHALIPFFGKKGALKIFEHLHEKQKKVTTIEELILASGDPMLRMLPEEKWSLLGLSHPPQVDSTPDIVSGEEGDVSIRRHY